MVVDLVHHLEQEMDPVHYLDLEGEEVVVVVDLMH